MNTQRKRWDIPVTRNPVDPALQQVILADLLQQVMCRLLEENATRATVAWIDVPGNASLGLLEHGFQIIGERDAA